MAVAVANSDLIVQKASFIGSIDDDHSRMKSFLVDSLTSLKHANNPAKALGPAMTALCEALTGFFVSGRFERKGKKVREIAFTVFKRMECASSESGITPHDQSIFAADRGCMSESIVDFLVSVLRCKSIGAHKRNLSHPFIFGSRKLIEKRKGRLLPEKRARAAFGARKLWDVKGNRLSRKRRVHVEALACREAASGRIATAIHNDLSALGADLWALAPLGRRRGLRPAQTEKALGRALWSRRISDLSPRGGPSQSLSEFSVEEECSAKLKVNAVMQNVKYLTWLQSEDPCWLLMRAFRSTSRTTLGHFRALSENEDELWSMTDFDLSTSISEDELRKAFSALGAESAKDSTSASEAEFQENREMAEQQLFNFLTRICAG